MRIICGIFTLLTTVASPCFAQHHRSRPAPVGAPAIRFVEASLQTTRPGVRGSEPYSTWKFIVVWNSSTAPGTFFWRPEGERWMTCAVSRVHGFVSQTKTPFYKKEEVDLKDIRKGDMIELVPLSNGRDIMPPAVKLKAAGLIYFQRSGRGWETANPGKIHKLADMIMP